MTTRKFKYAVTHPGRAHRDDFLSACIIIAVWGIDIFRREPTKDELKDQDVLVFDIGGEHDPDNGNFDHHQFDRGHAPASAFSLLDDWCNWGFFHESWFRLLNIIDSKGPRAAAAHLGIIPERLEETISPEAQALHRLFSRQDKVYKIAIGEQGALYETMRLIGTDMLAEPQAIQADIDELFEKGWKVAEYRDINILVLPENKFYHPTAVGSVLQEIPMVIAACIGKAERGDGYHLYRYDDHPRLDFTLLDGLADIDFTHKGGFLATTRDLNCEPMDFIPLAYVN